MKDINKQNSRYQKKTTILILIMTIASITTNMAHPVTPELVMELGFDSRLFGTLFAAMSFSTFVMSPIWGNLSDQYGRKRFLIIGPIGYGLAQLGFGFSSNEYVIIMFRLLSGGFACAIFVSGLASLIDLTTVVERSKVMVLYTALTGFGANIGYFLGGYIGKDEYQYAFVAQFIFCIFLSMLIFFVFDESKMDTKTRTKPNLFGSLSKYKHTILPFMLIITILTSIITIGFNNGFNFYLKDQLSFNPFKLGIVMAITGLIGLFTNLVVYPILKKRFNDFYLLVVSIMILCITLGLATYYEKMNIRITLLIFFFAFLALYKPLIQTIISKLGNNNGEVMGLNNAANAMGMVIGSFYTGWMYGIDIHYTFFSFAFVGFIVFILLMSKRNQLKIYNS